MCDRNLFLLLKKMVNVRSFCHEGEDDSTRGTESDCAGFKCVGIQVEKYLIVISMLVLITKPN